MEETGSAGDAGHLQHVEKKMKDGRTSADTLSLLSLSLIRGWDLNYFIVAMNDFGYIVTKCGSKDLRFSGMRSSRRIAR